MSIEIIGVFLGLLFLVIMYQQIKIERLNAQMKANDQASQLTEAFNLSVTMGLAQMLTGKGHLTEADFIEFSKTGKVTPISKTTTDDTKATV